MARRILASSAVAALLVTAALPAYAQRVEGFAVDRFEPAERGSQFFVVDTLDLRGHGRPAVGAVFDYGYKPLVAYDLAGNERSAIVRHQLFMHLGASVVLWNRLRLGANLPFALHQDGDPTTVNGVAFKPADQPAIGDLRLAADVRIVGERTDPFTLAVGVRGWLPTGFRSQFTSDGGVRVGPQVLVAGDLGVLAYGARLAAIVRDPERGSFAGSSVASELVGSVGVGLKTRDNRFVIGPEVFASSPFDGNAFFKTRGTPAEWILGAHWDPAPGVRLGAGGGGGITRGYGAPVVRGLFSLEWTPDVDRLDRDADGIPDDEDACPAQPGPRHADPRLHGCPVAPPPPPDRDQDGIVDERDACPTVPGPSNVDPKLNGCPDRDQDGVPDHVDACPDDKGAANDDPRKHGCPPDRDEDGVADALDACPDVKGVKTADPKTNGCPPDTDGDGILDGDDACPQAPGPHSSDPKKNGCPLVIVTEKAIQITEQVKFKFNSAELLKESDGVLEAVRAVLEAHPEITKLRVEGHTDNVGNAAYNKQLSGRRAASVTKWLTDHGIKKERLVSAGFGMEEPVDSNDTEQGRANNRRVAFTILGKDETKKTTPGGSPTP